MAEQILLQGEFLGFEAFLLSRPGAAPPPRAAGEDYLTGKCQWFVLLGEVVPRALLAELQLPRVLLGTSGGGQFLVILPGDMRDRAHEFLAGAAERIAAFTHGAIRLIWAFTENLGDWSIVRRRLNDGLHSGRSAPLATLEPAVFEPFVAGGRSDSPEWLTQFGAGIREAAHVSWSPDSPGLIELAEGRHTWALTQNVSLDGLKIARHVALTDDGKQTAGLPTLGKRAHGRSQWGVLRGDVDNFGVRLRRVQTIEEHVQLSIMYKHFLAGEIDALCSQPEYFKRLTVLYAGGADFAVYGSWDALIHFARELQRLFHRFTEENLKEFPGADGKTLTMALSLAPEPHARLAAVFEESGRDLQIAKSYDKDCIYLLGRVLEWKQLADAAEMKDTVTRLAGEFRGSRRFLGELRRFYKKESHGIGPRAPAASPQSVWRFQRRFNRILSGTRRGEFQKLRTHLITEMTGRKSTEVKLRPAGLVALEWARLATE